MSKSLLAAVVALTACAMPAWAGPDRVSILLGSVHLNSSGYEAFNPGIFATWTGAALAGRGDITVGGYRNSYGDGSLAVALSRPLIERDIWSIDAFGAVAWYPGNGDRFKLHAGDLVPLIGLQARIGQTFVQVVPGGDRGTDATIGIGLTFSLHD